ncbi:MAG: GNAT family N-acetyltransferase [Deltaproteobacteria bacterium]|nr:GNAT family N-acetyltransferase [Deltaproteobacteria bacterium]
MPVIRPPHKHETAALHALWERSVRATHRFLAEADILLYRPMVRDLLASSMEFWVACDDAGAVPLGFSGLDYVSREGTWKLEALFIDPDASRQGLGSLLVTHARMLKGPLSLDVNEQNPGARAFYRKRGFTETGRSPVDGAGRPFPLIHMRG